MGINRIQEDFFRGKGNRSLPWSDEEEWEFGESGSGGLGKMRDQDGRRIGGDREQDRDRDRDQKCQCAKLGVVLRGF